MRQANNIRSSAANSNYGDIAQHAQDREISFHMTPGMFQAPEFLQEL